jgi:multisubunit Na+/H+ antiporter MnhB subunit
MAMGRDSWRFAQHERERAVRKRQNPMLRGLGCLVIVALGLLAYFFSGWFLQANVDNAWIYLPAEIILPPEQAPWIPAGFLVRLVVAVMFMVGGYGLVSLLYSILFPIKPGETDVPKAPRPPKKKKR